MTPTIPLNGGGTMPRIGQGVFKVPPADAQRLVETGITCGYRAVDTASYYRNEEGVGAAIRASGERVFVTTKLWNADQGRDAARAACERSLSRLGLDRIDLYLIHWPTPERDLYVETWETLIRLRDEGLVGAIGVSNFRIADLERIIAATGVTPATNQIELHPAFRQDALVAFHRAHGVATTCWAPLGRGALLGDAVIASIAAEHGRTPAQVILRWHLERGLVVIPKASGEARLRENLAITDFALDGEDMAAIAALARADGRIGLDPETMHWA